MKQDLERQAPIRKEINAHLDNECLFWEGLEFPQYPNAVIYKTEEGRKEYERKQHADLVRMAQEFAATGDIQHATDFGVLILNRINAYAERMATEKADIHLPEVD